MADLDGRTLPFTWLLGHDILTRRWLFHWLVSVLIYVILLVGLAYVDATGLMSTANSRHLFVLIPAALLLCYALVRSGWTRGLNDPALAVPQMYFAIFMIADSNLLIREVRGFILVLLPLVQLFGAFSLSPLRIHQVGLVAVFVLGIDIILVQQTGRSPYSAQVDLLLFGIGAVTVTVTAFMTGRLSRMRRDLQSQSEKLEAALKANHQLARQDPLTNLPNRRHAEELLAYEERRHHRQASDTCICLLDLDNFKTINDQRGHPTGDEVLRVFAREAALVLRDADVLARWGGEEFLILMPDTNLADGLVVLERLRTYMAQGRHWAFEPGLAVTFSAGLAALQTAETTEGAISRADAALYQAKVQGRDRLVAA